MPNIGLADVTVTATVTTDWGTTVEKDIIGYTFDGGKDHHTITGLTVTGSDDYAGLFGYIGEDGKVKDVTLEGVKIESDNGMSYVGGVAGWSYGGKIENCSVSGSVSGSGNIGCAGGVVGYQYGGSITECSSSATVNAGNKAGGVAGGTNNGTILTACYATGSVSVENNTTNAACAGGVVGQNGSSSTLQACYAWGSVTGSGSGTIYVGGVTGANVIGTLTACYHAKGDVSGPDGTTGGVTGRNYKDPMFGSVIITACYWGGNGQEQGIGENQAGTTGGTTQVTDGDWSGAKDAMNDALSGSGWTYELKDGNSLPTLKKEQ